jgi:ubiquinone/menaquinone biosynthesis C-methylase UbiE
MTSRRTYLSATGWHWLTPIYDPLSRLFGGDANRSTLLEEMDLATGERVLDIGCATGTLIVLLKQLRPGIAVVGLDPDPSALARAERKARRAGVLVHFSRGFSDQLPFANGSFDRVSITFMFSLLSLSEKEATLREIARVLRPGGSFHLLDLLKPPPLGVSLKVRLLGHGPGIQVCSEEQMVALMGRAGLAGAKTRQQTLWFAPFWPVATYRASRCP